MQRPDYSVARMIIGKPSTSPSRRGHRQDCAEGVVFLPVDPRRRALDVRNPSRADHLYYGATIR